MPGTATAMGRHVCICLIVMMAGAFSMTRAQQQVTLLAPTEDAFIGSDVTDLNMGGMDTLSLGTFNDDRRGRVLVKFDPAPAGIPRSRPVTRAILRLNWHHYLWWHPGNVIRVYRVLRPWEQGTGAYRAAEAGEVTWNSAQHGTKSWTVPGCAGAGDRGAQYVERPAAEYNLDFDVTPLYTAWQQEGAAEPVSFLIDADGAGQQPADPYSEYLATMESSESDEAAGVTLMLVEGTAPGTHVPLWSHTCLDGGGLPQPAQFGFVENGVFYGASYNGHVYKLDFETGALLADWTVSASGCYSAPLRVNGGLYVFARDKRFYRLDEVPVIQTVMLADYAAEAGTTRVESLAYDPLAGLFFLGTGSEIHAVDTNGVEHWSVPHPNVQWGEPMACDGALYTYDTGTQEVLKYHTTGPAAPELAWECDIGFLNAELAKGVDGDGEPLIFVSGWKHARPGTLTAVYDTGADAGQPKWGPINLPHTLKHCSVWEGHDLLLLPAQNGYVECRRASTGAFVKRIAILEAADAATPWSQVVLSGDYAVVATHDDTSGTDNYLYVFDIVSGRELWRSAAFHGSVGCMIPVLSGGIGIVGTYSTGTWHAFRLGEGDPVIFSRFANERHNGQVPGALRRVTNPEPLTQGTQISLR